MSEQINKVLYNVDQTADTTAAQKAQARANIGAQAQLTAGPNVTIDANNVISAAGFSGVSAVAPLYGDGTSENPLLLRTSHGLSLVQNSEDHITRLQVTHPVPPPGSSSAGKVLTCDDALENLSWQTPTPAPSIVQKLDYGDTSASTVSTLLIDNDDPEGYALVKADNVSQGYLVQGPYKGLLNSGINGGSGKGDSTTPLYIDSNGQFATCNAYPAGVFIAYWSGYTSGHDNTTYAAIKSAYDAGKAVFMYNTITGGDIWRVLDTIDANRAVFSRTSGAVTGGNYGNIVNSIVYVEAYDDSYHYMSCPLQPELTAGYRMEIVPGANDTVRINNTMHESVINTCIVWDTLSNTYDLDLPYGHWRIHVHLAAFSDWTQDDQAIHIRINHTFASEAAQKIKCGSYQVQNFYPYQSGNTYEFTNSHWSFDGTDPYTTSTNPDPYGFKFHLNATTPTRQMPTDQKAHRFIVDSGAPYGDWLELDASVRFMVSNATPSGNGIYLLLKGKYAYSYN